MISCKINVSKIDKNYLFRGEKGVYLDVILIPTPNGRYGDYMCVQGVPKEVKDRGIRGAILGNGREFLSQKKSAMPPPNQPTLPTNDEDPTNVPF